MHACVCASEERERERERELARKREGRREGGRERACAGFSETKTNEYKQRRLTKRSPDRHIDTQRHLDFFAGRIDINNFDERL